MTAVQPPGRYGALNIREGNISCFKEKPPGDGNWINGGYFVLEPEVIELVKGDETIWEKDPLEKLAEKKQLRAYLHSGFWQPMDTLRDKQKLEELWEGGKAPWRVW